MKICNNCNKTFSDENVFCEFCGSNLISMNQNGKSKKSNGGKGAIIAIVALSIFAAASVGFNIYQYSEYGDYEDRYHNINSKYYEMKNNIVPELQKKVDSYEKNDSKVNEEIEFYEKYVALVVDNGEKLYHTYSCEDFGNNGFWTYGISEAKNKGYMPCIKCHLVID